MKQFFNQLLRSRWLALCLHAGLWILLYLGVIALLGKAPDKTEAEGMASQPLEVIPVARLNGLFAPDAWPAINAGSNSFNPFYTTHFIPPVIPAGPPPTTKKIELTYQGFFQTEGGPRRAMVKFGDQFLVAPEGEVLTSHVVVLEATMTTLTLTNPISRTNILPLNVKKEIEVPIP